MKQKKNLYYSHFFHNIFSTFCHYKTHPFLIFPEDSKKGNFVKQKYALLKFGEKISEFYSSSCLTSDQYLTPRKCEFFKTSNIMFQHFLVSGATAEARQPSDCFVWLNLRRIEPNVFLPLGGCMLSDVVSSTLLLSVCCFWDSLLIDLLKYELSQLFFVRLLIQLRF